VSEQQAVTLGDLVSIFYEEFLALYGDEDLAATAAAATVNELLAEELLGDEKPQGE